MKILLYKNKSERNRLNKTGYIAPILDENNRPKELDGTLREATSITNVSIKIEYGFIDFNYVYIPEFNRYYFVDDFVVINNNLYEIILTVDVLMSFKDYILDLECFIDRNEFEFDPMITDDKIIIKEGYNLLEEKFNTTDVFARDNLGYVISGYKFTRANPTGG